MNRRFLEAIFLAAACSAMGQSQAPLATIDAAKTGPPISPYVYGQFIEHIGGLIYGSLWCARLRRTSSSNLPKR